MRLFILIILLTLLSCSNNYFNASTINDNKQGTYYSGGTGTGTGTSTGTGTGTGTENLTLKSLTPSIGASITYAVDELNKKIYFSTSKVTNVYELWVTDGTLEGSLKLKSFDHTPYNLCVSNGILFFNGYDSVNGYELWKSEGTSESTFLVKNINSSSHSSPRFITSYSGGVMFIADGDINSFELWKSDGSFSGTVLVKGKGTSFGFAPYNLIEYNGLIYFSSVTGFSINNDATLWRSDGTAAGTYTVKIINPGGGSYPSDFYKYKNELYFSANTTLQGYELWKTDGTAQGTVLVKDINPLIRVAEDTLCDSFPHSFKEFNGYLYFVADEGINGEELWKTDGTSNGTYLVKNINDSDSSSISFLTSNGTKLFFYANDGINGLELWSSSGTVETTQLIMNISLIDHYTYLQPVIVGTYCYFTPYNGSGFELWRTDGSLENTNIITISDLNGGSAINPSVLISAFGSLFFVAETGTGSYLFIYN